MSEQITDKCKFSTYGYACGKPVEHGRYLCEEHAKATCSSCGQSATHGCDFCGQFVCGMPLCDECTYGTDESKSAGAWGFLNHIHVSKPEFATKHENMRLQKQTIAGFQSRVAGAHHALFHDDPTDIEERRARFFEEAIETVQAFGMSTEDMHGLVEYSGNRPLGEPKKEIGAAMLTLASLCVIAGIDLMECAEADLAALQTPEKIAKVRAKRATRHGRGPLPGFDPASSSEEEHTQSQMDALLQARDMS